MNASMLNAKALLLIAGVAMLVPLGVGVAYATSSDGDSSGRATETNLDKAKSVALQQVEGRLTGSEIGVAFLAPHEYQANGRIGCLVDSCLPRLRWLREA